MEMESARSRRVRREERRKEKEDKKRVVLIQKRKRTLVVVRRWRNDRQHVEIGLCERYYQITDHRPSGWDNRECCFEEAILAQTTTNWNSSNNNVRFELC